MENFSIQIKEFFIHFSETSPVFGLKAQLNLSSASSSSDQSGFSLSVEGGFKIHTKIINIPSNNDAGVSRQKWSVDRFTISDIGVDVTTNAFTFKGNLSFRQNDPVYGNGFALREWICWFNVNTSSKCIGSTFVSNILCRKSG
jgi:hypothetical protein